MKWLLIILCSILFFSGCCGSEVVLRKVEVKTPGMIDTLEAEKFKIKTMSISHFDSLMCEDSLIEVTGYRGIS